MLKSFGESLLWGWFQPELNIVGSEHKLLHKLKGLELTPEQHSLADSAIVMNQWALGKTQPFQPFNDLLRRLITSIGTQRQTNTILLILAYRMADQKLNLHHVLATTNKPAIMPRDKRNHFKFDPVPSVFET